MQQVLISAFVSKTQTQTKPRHDSLTLPTQPECTAPDCLLSSLSELSVLKIYTGSQYQVCQALWPS